MKGRELRGCLLWHRGRRRAVGRAILRASLLRGVRGLGGKRMLKMLCVVGGGGCFENCRVRGSGRRRMVVTLFLMLYFAHMEVALKMLLWLE